MCRVLARHSKRKKQKIKHKKLISNLFIIKTSTQNSLITSGEEPDQMKRGLLPRRTVVLYVCRRIRWIDDLFTAMKERVYVNNDGYDACRRREG
jgi:hypothetical protein